MAGAGYKLFNTGDVLTAAQVNTYLMEQTVMVFADAAARTTALSGVVSEGMISYLKDTNAVEVYNGSAWVASDDPNAIQNTIVDAKGDLISASAADTPARLAVGNNGETLVADSSATTGLRYREDYAAGKNKIINGDFNINQRGFTTTTSVGTYTFDRWRLIGVGGTSTLSAQTFTPGAAPVAGYESTNFVRLESTGQSAAGDNTRLGQRIEDVRTFAGETVTISFWAKASSGTPDVAAFTEQFFGSGGSTTVTNNGNKVEITTSWDRYSITLPIASISGKTIGSGSFLGLFLTISAGSNFNTPTNSLGIQSVTIDFWGVQVEAGSVATAFQTATGNPASELAACQRYYYRITQVAGNTFNVGFVDSTTVGQLTHIFPTPMRVAPTALEQSGTAADYALRTSGSTVTNCSAVPAFSNASPNLAQTVFTVASGLTAGQGCQGRCVTTGAFLGWSAEL